MFTEMSPFDIRAFLISCAQKLSQTDQRKSKERARARWIKSSSVSARSELLEEAADLKQIILSDGESAGFV